MSLLRLLSSGKSLIGGATDNTVRYRMGKPGMLPKFRSTAKPVKSSSKRARVATNPEGSQAQPTAGPAASGQPAVLPKKSFSPRAIYKSFLNSIQARLTRLYVKPSRPTPPRPTKLHLQAELSLDKVRVVRNDLSDSDLEVVPRRASGVPVAKASGPKSVESSGNAAMSSASGRVEAASTQS
jgi:hypothetical protein